MGAAGEDRFLAGVVLAGVVLVGADLDAGADAAFFLGAFWDALFLAGAVLEVLFFLGAAPEAVFLAARDRRELERLLTTGEASSG